MVKWIKEGSEEHKKILENQKHPSEDVIKLISSRMRVSNTSIVKIKKSPKGKFLIVEETY